MKARIAALAVLAGLAGAAQADITIGVSIGITGPGASLACTTGMRTS